MNAKDAPMHQAMAALLDGIVDPAERLKVSAQRAARSRAAVNDLRDERNIALAVLYLRRGWSKTDCYKLVGIDRHTFGDALERLPGVIVPDVFASVQHTVTVSGRDPRAVVEAVTVSEEVTQILEKAEPGGLRFLSATSDVVGKRIDMPRVSRRLKNRPALTWSGSLDAKERVTIGYTVAFPAPVDGVTASPGLDVSKVASAPAGVAPAGEMQYYRLEARNTTGEALSGVSFSEAVFSGAVAGAVASHGELGIGDGRLSVSWTGDLLPGQTVSVIWWEPAGKTTRPARAKAAADSPQVKTSANRSDMIEVYARLLGEMAVGNELVRFYADLLDLATDDVVAIALEKAAAYNDEYAMWKTAQAVRDTLTLQFIGGELGQPWTNAQVARVTGLTTAAIAQLRTGTRNPPRPPGAAARRRAKRRAKVG